MDHVVGGRRPVVGRDKEIAIVGGFLLGVRDGFAALVLEGEAGIGKTAVWHEGVAAARANGYRILSTRPGPSEATFSFAALGDLVEATLDQVRHDLPGPQIEALDVALLRAPAGKRAPERRAVAVAVLGVLRALARSVPIVLAIDDMQWVDRASLAVLEFAIRRLSEEPIRLLATLRSPESHGANLTSGLDPGRVRPLGIGGLSAGALHHVLMSELGRSVSRPVLLRIHEATGGNPFFALEMARALMQPSAARQPGGQLPMPESLSVLVRDRLASLSPRDRDVLVHVAAMARPTLAILESALPDRLHAKGALGRVAEARVIVLEGDRMRFSHPLLGSVLYADTPLPERRRVHRRLAAVVADPEERVRHLALAADGPDAEVASALDRAAEQARSRGATSEAASLSRLALRLTPAADVADGSRRTIHTADYLFLAGEGDEARGMLQELATSMPPGPARGEVLWRLGRMRHEGYDFSSEYIELFRRALAEVPNDQHLRALILNALAWAELHDDHEAAAKHAAQSALAAEEAGDLGMLADSLASVGFFACARGSPEEEAAFERAMALEPHVEGLYIDERPSWVRAVSLVFHDRFDEARVQIRSLIDEALEGGEENALPTLRFRLSTLESWAGNWRDAEEQADLGYEEAIQTDQPVAAARLLHAKALVHALQGLLTGARGEAAESLRVLESRGQPASVQASARCVLGFIALSEGEPDRAVAELSASSDALRRAGIGEPGMHRLAADLAEAHILCGDTDAAEDVIAELEEQGRRLCRAYALATGARCRALLQTARGDLVGALASLERALKEHGRLPSPFELGRTHLTLGRVQRRSKLKRQARDSLQRALGIFEGLGAPVWGERARTELARIGGRVPGPATLTPTEERVAALAAEGRTNREIADQLFMTVRTVEWNLSKVYRKLQVRSRTELSRAVGRD